MQTLIFQFNIKQSFIFILHITSSKDFILSPYQNACDVIQTQLIFRCDCICLNCVFREERLWPVHQLVQGKPQLLYYPYCIIYGNLGMTVSELWFYHLPENWLNRLAQICLFMPLWAFRRSGFSPQQIVWFSNTCLWSIGIIFIILHRKISRGGTVLALSVRLQPFRPDAYLGNGILDFIVFFSGICTCIWGRLTPGLVALHQLEIELWPFCTFKYI